MYPPSMTTMEVLKFEAALHLPTDISAAERQRCCLELVALMGLGKAAHTLVGSRGGGCCWEVLALVGLGKAAHTLVGSRGAGCYTLLASAGPDGPGGSSAHTGAGGRRCRRGGAGLLLCVFPS